jgi:dUTPase
MANYSILCTVNAYVTGFMGILGYLDGDYYSQPEIRVFLYNMTNSAITCTSNTYMHLITLFKK